MKLTLLQKVPRLPSAIAHYSLGSVIVLGSLVAYGFRVSRAYRDSLASREASPAL